MKTRTRTIDEIRYLKRLENIIKARMQDIVNNNDIIESAPEDKVRIRIPMMDEPYFKPVFPGSGAGAGSGSGNEPGEGSEEGEHEIEIELTVEELSELLFEYLGLPKIKPKGSSVEKEEYIIEGISKTGPRSRIHRRKTYYEIMKYGYREDSLRYKHLRKKEMPIFDAIVYFARDYSASIDDRKKFKIKSTSFWINNFIKYNYKNVKTKFAVHDTKAKFVNEHEFFRLSEGGATICSSVFELIYEDYKNYSVDDYNFYLFYFSDGENLPDDNPKLRELVEKLSEDFNLIAYGEVKSADAYYGYGSKETLVPVFSSIGKENIFAEKVFSVKDFIVRLFGDNNER